MQNEPSKAAKAKARELIMLQTGGRTVIADPDVAKFIIEIDRAFALFIGEVSEAMTILRKYIDRHGDVNTTEVLGYPSGKVVFADFILPEPPDPLEDIVRSVVSELGITGASTCHTIRADDFRASLKRALAAAKKETGDGE